MECKQNVLKHQRKITSNG